MMKLCPFCGGMPEIKQTGKLKMKIRCIKCNIGIEQKVLRFDLEWLENSLIETWNKRTDANIKNLIKVACMDRDQRILKFINVLKRIENLSYDTEVRKLAIDTIEKFK